eukprot:Seg18395.1 transcript_id=Seg18395.1/GoldUCD/mRNA.D3Y31 product="hypothetical protein" protein_id=Seg18395.1/GoldUCD/D3Y31
MVSKPVAADVEYQRQALTWLFDKLAEAKPSAVTNVHRHKVEPRLDPTTKGLSSMDRNKAREFQKEVYYGLPFELTFKGSEETLKNFLESLAQSEKYFFSVRSLRIQNENTEAVKAEADFQDAPSGGASGGDITAGEFAFPDDEGGAAPDLGEGEAEEGAQAPVAPVAATDTGLLIKKISGGEELVVFLKLDLLVFKDPENNNLIALPKLPNDGKKKAQPKKTTEPTKKGDK